MPPPRAHRFYPRPLLFLHIPKAAGSTLMEIVVRQYPGGKGFRFTGSPENLAGFIGLSEPERASYDVLHGHVAYGVHRHIPGDATSITMLRDPVERIISHYYFVLRKPDHYLHERVSRGGGGGGPMTLRQYVEQRTSIELDNDQTRYFIEQPDPRDRFTPITPELLEAAKANLERRMVVVGLAERFDESLVLAQCAFGWLNVTYERKNVTENRPGQAAIDPQTLDLIRDINRYDVALYEHAVTLFERQVSTLGDVFDERLRLFRSQQARRAEGARAPYTTAPWSASSRPSSSSAPWSSSPSST